MQDNNIQPTNQPDVLSEKIRQTLANHELPVDAACWDEINARMNSAKKKRAIPFWWWASGGAVAALFALLLTIPMGNHSVDLANSSTTDKHIQEKTTSTAAIKTDSEQASTKTATLKQADRHGSLTPKMAIPRHAATSRNPELALSEKAKPDAVLENKTAVDTKNDLLKEAEIASVETSTKDSATTTSKKKYIPDTLIEQPDNTINQTPKSNKNEWLLAAAFGTGGNTSPNSPNDFTAANYSNKSLTDAATNYSNIMTPNNFSQRNFMAPLSFGLTVRKNLNKTFALESGLAYTYLLSTFKETGLSSYDASLTLHYLGVPLNLVAKLKNNPKWDIYVAGGGMVEKGLRSMYTQNQYTGNQTITTRAATNIVGLQWSLNAGLGATYKLERRIGIYFEPKLSYYFNNNQPISARTDQPLGVGLTAGVRYEFK